MEDELELGDIVRLKAVDGREAFRGNGQLVITIGRWYQLVRFDGQSGGGVSLGNGKQAWVFPREDKGRLEVLEKRAKLKLPSVDLGKVFNEGEFVVYNSFLCKVVEVDMSCGRVVHHLQKTENGESIKNIKGSSLGEAPPEVRMRVSFRRMGKKLTRESLGTKEECEKVRPGCIVRVRNLEECEKAGFEIGRERLVTCGGDDQKCRLADSLPQRVGDRLIEKSWVEFVRNIRGRKFRVSKMLVETFAKCHYDEAPVVLLGSNNKGVVDVSVLATDWNGCGALATMPAYSLAKGLKELKTLRRRWVGFGVVFNCSGLTNFTATALERLMEKDVGSGRFYVSILPGGKMFPYRMGKLKNRTYLLPVHIEVVD